MSFSLKSPEGASTFLYTMPRVEFLPRGISTRVPFLRFLG